jgi:hypothetical protein
MTFEARLLPPHPTKKGALAKGPPSGAGTRSTDPRVIPAIAGCNQSVQAGRDSVEPPSVMPMQQQALYMVGAMQRSKRAV